MAAKKRGREEYVTQMVGEDGQDGGSPPGVGIKTIERGEAAEDDGGGRRGAGGRGGERERDSDRDEGGRRGQRGSSQARESGEDAGR